MSKPKATVIINTVNEVPERLFAAINSYKAQKYVNLQIMVSTIEGDPSIAMAEQLKVECVINPEKGIYQQLNNAMQYIRGDWWCYASGNDTAYEFKIASEIEMCIKNKKLVCYSDFMLRDPETKTEYQKKFHAYDYEKHLIGNFVNDCAIMHISLVQKYAPFRYEQWGNDSHYDFWLRVYEGEGDVFIHNSYATWIYNEYKDSKHVKRIVENNPDEISIYQKIREAMLKSHVNKNNIKNEKPFETQKRYRRHDAPAPKKEQKDEVPLITVGLPVYDSRRIVWLALESLCRQKTDIYWELVVAEETFNYLSAEFYSDYADRLKMAGCIRISYIPVTENTAERDRIALTKKWKMIIGEASNTSLGLMLQAADCYSEPNRIQTTYEKLSEGYQWISSAKGVFYHLTFKKTMLYDIHSGDFNTGLNMTLAMDIAKQLPDFEKYSGVDSWIFENAKIISPDLKIFLDESEAWKNGIDTDGENKISVLRKNNYEYPLPPFVKTDMWFTECVPNDISEMLYMGEKKREIFLSESKMATYVPPVEKEKVAIKKQKRKKIQQCYVSSSIKFFEDKIFDRYGFKNKRTNKTKDFIIDPEKPLIVWGMYHLVDRAICEKHKSLVVVVWAGSDSLGETQADLMQWFVGKQNIVHISGSAWINKDLEAVGIKYKYLPISICDHSELSVKPLGEKIYIYTSVLNPAFYGSEIYDRLINIFGKQNFIICHAKQHTKEELYKLYEDCFIGLRLVEHDGLSETVAELGLMGRKVIYNGDTPNSLNYSSIDGVLSHIWAESEKKGKVQAEVAEKMKKYLNIGEDWLYTDYYYYEFTVANTSGTPAKVLFGLSDLDTPENRNKQLVMPEQVIPELHRMKVAETPAPQQQQQIQAAQAPVLLAPALDPNFKVTIKMRTHRKGLFDNCMKSILDQTWIKRINIIVIYDNEASMDYIAPYLKYENVKTVKVQFQHAIGEVTNIGGLEYTDFPYNTYFNQVPKEMIESGMMFYLDDDDRLSCPTIIEELFSGLTRKALLVWKIQLRSGRIIPMDMNWEAQRTRLGDITGESFAFHTDYIGLAQWDKWKAADYRVIERLRQNITEAIFIDKIVMMQQ